MAELKSRGRVSFFVKLAVVAFLIFCIVGIVRLRLQISEAKKESAELDESILKYNDKIEQITEELEKPFDDEYVKKYARDKLNYRLPEEILFYDDSVD